MFFTQTEIRSKLELCIRLHGVLENACQLMAVNTCLGWKYLWKHYMDYSEYSSYMWFSVTMQRSRRHWNYSELDVTE